MTFAGLCLAALVLGAAAAWVALGGGNRAVFSLSAYAVLTAIGCWPMPTIGRVVAHDLTVLHEGGTGRTIAALLGVDAHVGPLWRDAVGAFAHGSGELPVFAIGRLNLALTAASAAGLAVTSALVAGRAAAVPFALLALATCGGLWNGLHAETPAPAVWFAFVTAVPAWKILDEAVERPQAHLALAAASLAASVAVAVGVRSEYVIVGAPLAALALAGAALGGARVEAAWAAVRGLVGRLLRAHWLARGAAVAALLVASWGVSFLGFHERLRAAALVPTLALQGPAALLGAVSAPVAALAAVGVVSFARAGVARASFALSLTSLTGVYLTASHGVGWEMLRYGTMMAAGVWLAAAAGWGALERWSVERAWHPSWRGSLALLAAFFVPTPWGANPTGPGWWDADARARRGTLRRLVDRSAQREARRIVRSIAEAPDCLHVARVRHRGEPDAPLRLVTFARDRAPEFVRDESRTVRDLRAEAGACLRYVLSLDCALRRAGALCDGDLRGADPLDVVSERFAPYDDPAEYGEHTSDVRYGVWNVRMEGP